MIQRYLRFAACVVILALACVGQGLAQKKMNVLVIMGDDIGWYNASIYNRGDMG